MKNFKTDVQKYILNQDTSTTIINKYNSSIIKYLESKVQEEPTVAEFRALLETFKKLGKDNINEFIK